MYDIGVALRRFKGLVRWTARKYAVRGHFRLSVEDLEAEGLLTLVQCCQSFPEGQVRFARYFKRAWHNRLKKLMRFGYQKKRQGFEVDLEYAEALAPEPTSDFLERMQIRARELSPYLSEDARAFLQVLLEPSEEVLEYAWRDYCRRNKLHSQGVHVPGWKRFRVRTRHIKAVLHISSDQMWRTVREIRFANRQLARWRNTAWPKQ